MAEDIFASGDELEFNEVSDAVNAHTSSTGDAAVPEEFQASTNETTGDKQEPASEIPEEFAPATEPEKLEETPAAEQQPQVPSEPQYVIDNQIYTIQQLQESGLLNRLIERSQTQTAPEKPSEPVVEITSDMIVNQFSQVAKQLEQQGFLDENFTEEFPRLGAMVGYFRQWLQNVTGAVEALQSNQSAVGERIQRDDQFKEAEKLQNQFFTTFDDIAGKHALFEDLKKQDVKIGFLDHLSKRGYTVEQMSDINQVQLAYLDYQKNVIDMVLNGQSPTTQTSDITSQAALTPSNGGINPTTTRSKAKPEKFAPMEELYNEEPVIGA